MSKRPDRLHALVVFKAIVETGSFSAAARRLGLTPSAVSRTIDRTESRLGVRLLTRSTRALNLTPEGQRFGIKARSILKELDAAEEEIVGALSPAGLVRVSVAVSHGRLVIVPLLAEFSHLFPKIEIELSLTDLLEDPAQGETDIAIRFGALPDSTLNARKLGDEPMVVVAAPTYLAQYGTPRVPLDLKAHQCLMFSFDRSRDRWPFTIKGKRHWVDVHGRFKANSGEALGMLAVAGAGIARVSRFAVAQELASGALELVLPKYAADDSHPVHALFAGGTTMPARARVLVDFLAERLADKRSRERLSSKGRSATA